MINNFMRKLGQSAVILSIIILFDLLYFHFVPISKGRTFFLQVYFIILSVLFFILWLTIFYVRSAISLKKRSWLAIPLVVFGILISGFLAGRLRDMVESYDLLFVVRNLTEVGEGLHRKDPNGSWLGNKNSRGYHYYSIGDSIKGKVAVIHDSLGFRNVPENMRVNSDTLDLFIGCSFTFGSLIKAEDGFPYLVSKTLNHRMMNGSMGGYGLAQMQMCLDSVLPVHKFKYVFIQMSPWLSERSMYFSGMHIRGYPPLNYFADLGDEIRLMPKAYNELDSSRLRSWKGHVRSYSDRLNYFSTNGFAEQVKSYLTVRFIMLKGSLGLIPAPIKDKFKLEKYFYDKAIEDVRKTGAIPVLYKLYWDDQDFAPLRTYLKGKAEIIDCDAILDSNSRNLGIDKYHLYRVTHFHKGQKIFFDPHPNEFANRLISEQILLSIPDAR